VSDGTACAASREDAQIKGKLFSGDFAQEMKVKQFEYPIRKEISGSVQKWLADYEMPVSVFGVVTALNSLGYLSSRPTQESADWTSAEAKLSERKTVHEWLNDAGVPREEFNKPICLLRRLRIAVDRLSETASR
jgi:hypothetical protein